MTAVDVGLCLSVPVFVLKRMWLSVGGFQRLKDSHSASCASSGREQPHQTGKPGDVEIACHKTLRAFSGISKNPKNWW